MLTTARIIIEDPIPFQYQILEDSNLGKFVVRGRFQMGDLENKNGRVYPTTLWKKILSNGSQFQERLRTRQVFGELDHPADGKTSLQRASHIVTHLQFSEANSKEVLGEAEILDTPAGRILKELFRANAGVGISSRGNGSLVNGNQVHEDFVLDTFDFVAAPSTQGAFPTLVGVGTSSSSSGNGGGGKGVKLESVLRIREDLLPYQEEGVESLIKDRKRALSAFKALWGMQAKLEEVTLEGGSGLSREILEQVVGFRRELEEQMLLKPVVQEEGTSDVGVSDGSNDEGENSMANEPTGQAAGVDTQLADLQAKYAELEAKFNSAMEIIDELRGRVVDASGETDEVKSELQAAEAMVQRLSNKVRSLPENAGSYIKASHKLIEAMGSKLRDRVKRQTATEALLQASLARCAAAESLIEAMVGRIKEKEMARQIDSVLEGELRAHAKHIRPLLENCQTMDEVRTVLEGVRPLLKGKRQETDEPSFLSKSKRGRTQLTEDTLTSGAVSERKRQVVSEGATLASLAVARIGGR